MEYRAVIGEDGHFIRAVQLVCSDDSAARAEAKRLVDGHDIELWQGDRKVATFVSRRIVNRRSNLTLYRRPILTPLSGAVWR